MKRIGAQRTLRLVTAAALVAAIAAGATYATTSVTGAATATNTIQACVKDNGDVRIVGSADDCVTPEHAISWNVVGPAGPPGKDGQSVASSPLGIGSAGCPFGGSQFVVGIAPPTFACNGAAGTSVRSTSLDVGSTACPYGGSSFAVGDAAPTYACNGAPGKDGKDATALTSIDGLGGLSCTRGDAAGTIHVTTDPYGVVTLTCWPVSSGGGGTGGGTSCVAPPDPPNGTAVCDSSGNVVYGCQYGYVDTDGNLADGCEQQLDLQNDPYNCGTPGNDVSSLPNAMGACRNGTAAIGFCFPGWTDGDGLVADGCEQADPSTTCGHVDGLGEIFSDCAVIGARPGNAATYSRDFALEAARVWADAHGGTAPTVSTCTGDPQDVVVSHLPGQAFSVAWSYMGATAGHVRVTEADIAACPTATDPIWY